MSNAAQLHYSQSGPVGTTTPVEYSADYSEEPNKRPRISNASSRDSYDQDHRYSQRSYMQQPGPYTTYPTQNPPLLSHSAAYQAPLSSPSILPEFSFRYPPPDSSSTSSPFVSPSSQMPSYTPTQSISYQQPMRYPSQGYLPSQLSAAIPSQVSRLAQPLSIHSQYAPVDQPQTDYTRSNNPQYNPGDQLQSDFARPYTSLPGQEEGSFVPSGTRQRASSTRETYYQYPQQGQVIDQSTRVPQQRHHSVQAPFSNLLPPLHSTNSSVPPVMATTSAFPEYITADNRTLGQTVLQVDHMRSQERYAAFPQTGGPYPGQVHREAG